MPHVSRARRGQNHRRDAATDRQHRRPRRGGSARLDDWPPRDPTRRPGAEPPLRRRTVLASPRGAVLLPALAVTRRVAADVIRVLRRWAFALWIPVYVGSVFILNGAHGRPSHLVAGGIVVLVACAGSVWLALGPGRGDPVHPAYRWAVGGVVLWYLLAAVAATILGPGYVVATALAGVVPTTAVALTVTTVRDRTADTGDGLEDVSAQADEDPAPGMGLDEDTPLGSTSELAGQTVRVDDHGGPARQVSDDDGPPPGLSLHDLPLSHPMRRELRRRRAGSPAAAPPEEHDEAEAVRHSRQEAVGTAR